MKLMRWFLMVALLGTQAACSDDKADELGPPAVEFKAAGVYKLRLVGTDPLPFGIRSDDSKGTVWSWIAGETLRIEADGRYRLTHTESGGLAKSYDFTGTYTVVDDSTVELSGGGRVVVSGAVATHSACFRGVPCVYVRDGADGGPSLTYTLHGLQTINGAPLEPGKSPLRGASVRLWGDGRYYRRSDAPFAPLSDDEEGTYELSDGTITLRPKRLPTLLSPDAYPLVGTYVGGTLTLGTHVYAPVLLP
jgi:hypothetical protein